MQLHEVKHLREVKKAAEAEAAIAEGWSLIAVIPNTQPGAGLGLVVYVLGRKDNPHETGGVTQADVSRMRERSRG